MGRRWAVSGPVDRRLARLSLIGRWWAERRGWAVPGSVDGRLARLAIFYVEGTSEDPEHGAHEDFVDIIERSATDVEVFPSGAGAERINRYLRSMHQ